MNQPDLETRSLKLLTEIHAELRDALNGLGGRTYEGAREAYRFHTAAHLNHAVEGYIYLRQGRRLDASKHLVRNAIEMLILLMAVQKKPELLFRIALNEHNDKKTQVRCMAHGDVSAALSAIDKQWSDFKSAYQTKYPEQQLVETQLSLRDIAQHAGIQSYYDTHYRLYCRFTHAAL